MDRKTITNIKLLHAMQTIVELMNAEEAYFAWIPYWIPDGAVEDDFIECAQSEEQMEEQCIVFRNIIRKYGKSGFYTGGQHVY